MPHIKFVDTTLRDGEQTPGVHFAPAQKLDIARRLAKTGIDVIEAGFPASSAGDMDAVREIAGAAANGELGGTAVSALARMTKQDIDAAAEALAPLRGTGKSRLHVFIATSDVHLENKLRMTREQALEAIEKGVSYAKSLDTFGEIEFSAEDATRTDFDYLCRAVRTAVRCGASVVNIPDTVGYTTPHEYTEILIGVRAQAPGDYRISVHCHNDLGMATANSLAAVEAGAAQIECTVNGLGERAGNAALEEIVMALKVRGDAIRGLDGETPDFGIITREITETSRLVASLSGVHVSPNKAIVGANAFSHASGIHQHGVMTARTTYEIMNPEDLGLNATTIVLGKLSGRHAFADRVSQMGYSLDSQGIDATFRRFKEIAEKKSVVTDEDVRAIVGEYLDSLSGRYYIDSFQIQSGNNIKAMALVSLRVKRLADGNSEGLEYAEPEPDETPVIVTEAAPGEGPIDAAFNAVNRIAGAENVELLSYGITAVTEGTDALGEAKVMIRVGGSSTVENYHSEGPWDKADDRSDFVSASGIYTGRGVSTDIIKASLKAYVNAINKWDMSSRRMKE